MLPLGIIFDLDDTLVHSALDFAQMRQDIHCPEGEDILGYVERLRHKDSEMADIAEAIIIQHEVVEAQTSQWIDGAKDFVEALHVRNIPTAIVTRNCREATAIKLQRNQIPIKTVLTREDAPAKPNPTALKNIAERWQIAPEKIAYVGDYLYDIQVAYHAGMQAWSFGYQTNDYPVERYFECYHTIYKELFTR